MASLEEPTMLGRTATLEDVGKVAAFIASDGAATMTAATVNISCGALVDRPTRSVPTSQYLAE